MPSSRDLDLLQRLDQDVFVVDRASRVVSFKRYEALYCYRMDNGTIAVLEGAEKAAWCDMYAAVPLDLRAALGFRVEHAGSAVALVLPAIDYPDFNRVIGLGVDEPATEEIVEHFLRIYSECGVRKFLIHLAPNAKPSNLRKWLSVRGLVGSRRWAKVYLHQPPMNEIRTELHIEAVPATENLTFGKAVCAGFGMPERLAPWPAALVGRDGWRTFVAKDGEDAVAAAALYVRNDVAWLGMGATRPSHRRRGAQGALMARRIAEGLGAGCRWIVTEGVEDLKEKPNPSLHNMMRNGFQLAYLRENFALP